MGNAQKLYTITGIPGTNVVASSDALDVRACYGSWPNGAFRVQIGGTFVGTLKIEETINGTNWVTCDDVAGVPCSGITAPGIYDLPFTSKVRLTFTAHTSGTPTGCVLGPID